MTLFFRFFQNLGLGHKVYAIPDQHLDSGLGTHNLKKPHSILFSNLLQKNTYFFEKFQNPNPPWLPRFETQTRFFKTRTW